MHEAGVKMNDVKCRGILENLIELKQMRKQRDLAMRIQAKRMFARGNQPGTSQRIPACEKGYVLTLADQFFG
jgi:hypothetical protein